MALSLLRKIFIETILYLSLFLEVLYFCIDFWKWNFEFDRKKQGKKESTWRIFALKELQLATNNFNYDNKLGEGGFGSVYWGQLRDGSQVRLRCFSFQFNLFFVFSHCHIS